ncbi:hypothetical protein AB0D57_31790, partial [Streptomyces sp. NPDC048275]
MIDRQRDETDSAAEERVVAHHCTVASESLRHSDMEITLPPSRTATASRNLCQTPKEDALATGDDAPGAWDPGGWPGKAELRRILVRCAQIAQGIVEAPHTPGRPVINGVKPSGLLVWSPLVDGQPRWLMNLSVTLHPQGVRALAPDTLENPVIAGSANNNEIVIPSITRIYLAPVGTTAPADATVAMPAPLRSVGLTTEDSVGRHEPRVLL